MKLVTRVFSFGLPFAATIVGIASSPAFAQVTNIPITGTISGTVSPARAITINSYNLLSPVGTVSGTIGTVTSVTSGGNPVLSISTNSTYDITGTTTGGVVFNDGRTASFVNAPSTANATVTAINPGPTLTFANIPVTTSISLTINSGNIAIPTSSIVSPAPLPLTSPVTVTSPGIASAIVYLDKNNLPPISSQVITAFSTGMDSKVFPGLQP